MSDTLAGIKRESTKSELSHAYERYQRREPGSMDFLLTKVREFAYMKVYHLEYDFRKFGSAETADDWAQDVTLKVWRSLSEGTSNRTPASFYAWVHKIAFNVGNDAFTLLYKEREAKVGLTVQVTDDEGTHEEDNPEIYKDSPEDTIYFPPSVQGVNLTICKLLYEGWGYPRIATELQMSVNAVKKRLYALRDVLA